MWLTKASAFLSKSCRKFLTAFIGWIAACAGVRLALGWACFFAKPWWKPTVVKSGRGVKRGKEQPSLSAYRSNMRKHRPSRLPLRQIIKPAAVWIKFRRATGQLRFGAKGGQPERE